MKSVLNYKAYSLKAKLILLCIFSIFLPLLIISQLMLTVSENRFIEQTTELTRESANQTKNNIENLLKEYTNVITRMAFDETLKNYLNPRRDYSNNIDSLDAYQYYLKPLTYDFNFHYTTNSLKIYYVNETLMPGLGIYERIDENISQKEVYRRALDGESDIAWGTNENNIYLSRAIRNISEELYGVVSIEFPKTRLYSMIQESDPEKKRIIITDVSGENIVLNDLEIIDKHQSDNINKENYEFIYNTIEGKDMPSWQMTTQIPLESLRQKGVELRNTGFILITLTMILSIISFSILVNFITKRIKHLVQTMSFVKIGKLSTAEETEMEDEIGQLTSSFNLMINSLKKSIRENYDIKLSLKDAEIKKKEAELYALQSQINPHFLFNTLESIRMKLIASDNNEQAMSMVFNLSKILRKSLNWHGDMIPLKEELDFVHSYLEIQKSRFKDKIEVFIDNSEVSDDFMIPKLIIQPLVENAVKHGIENKKGKGIIHIKIYRLDNTIKIIVCDNGIGIESEKLDSIQKQLASKEKATKEDHSIGVKNVHERIILQYGQDYGLKIESTFKKGTVASIDIPTSVDEEEHND